MLSRACVRFTHAVVRKPVRMMSTNAPPNPPPQKSDFLVKYGLAGGIIAAAVLMFFASAPEPKKAVAIKEAFKEFTNDRDDLDEHPKEEDLLPIVYAKRQ